MHLTDIPYIRLCDNAAPSDTKRSFDPLKIHRVFGCCRFRNPTHITYVTDNITLIDTREPPTTFSAFSTTPKVNKGKPKSHHNYL